MNETSSDLPPKRGSKNICPPRMVDPSGQCPLPPTRYWFIRPLQ